MTDVLYPILCPICGAGRESRCRTLRSGRVTDYHEARRQAWYARAECPTRAALADPEADQ